MNGDPEFGELALVCHRSPLLICGMVFAACSVPGRNRAEFIGHQANAITVCATGPTVAGVDVSEWQGGVNWGAVASAGYGFAIARISDGAYHIDGEFGANWPGIKNAGMVRGAYQFYEAGQDPTAQANVVIQSVGQLGPGDLPVTMDLESGDGVPSVGEIQTWVNVVVQGTGKNPMIYTSPGYWDSYFGGQFASLPLWVADWGPSCPDTPNGWGNWQFWQWADSGNVPGIGNCDQDVFNGSPTDLGQVAGSDRPPIGWLDNAGCTGISGWSQDPDSPGQVVNVAILADGCTMGQFPAGVDRPDLCAAYGYNHGFMIPPAAWLFDGRHHQVHAYGLDTTTGAAAELSGSPKTLICGDPTAIQYNGDTFGDISIPETDQTKIPVCVSTRRAWSCASPGATLYADGFIRVGDVNGDRRQDLLQFRDDWQTIPICLSTETGWDCSNPTATFAGGDYGAGNNGTGIWSGATPLTGDFDGNGSIDVIQYSAGPSWASIPVCLSLEGSWKCSNWKATYAGGDYVAGYNGTGLYGGIPLLGDFNGDGKIDLVQFPWPNQLQLWKSLPVCFSTGHGWNCLNLEAHYSGGIGAGALGTGLYGGTPLIGDFNGDGKSDLIQFGATLGWVSIPVCLSTGNGWNCFNYPATYEGGAGAAANGSGIYNGSPLIGDFNGDGKADVIMYSSDQSWDTIPLCLSTGTGWSCYNAPAEYAGGDYGPAANGSGVYDNGIPILLDFDGDGRIDLAQYNPAWASIPVCLSRGDAKSGYVWKCLNLAMKPGSLAPTLIEPDPIPTAPFEIATQNGNNQTGSNGDLHLLGAMGCGCTANGGTDGLTWAFAAALGLACIQRRRPTPRHENRSGASS
jgi:lysozyme